MDSVLMATIRKPDNPSQAPELQMNNGIIGSRKNI